MFIKKKIIVTAILVAIVSLGVAAVTAPKNKFRNLKVLPKDISDAKQFAGLVAKTDKAKAVSLLVRRGDAVNYLVLKPVR